MSILYVWKKTMIVTQIKKNIILWDRHNLQQTQHEKEARFVKEKKIEYT